MSQSQSDEHDSNVGELDLPLPKNHNSLPRFCNLVRFFSRLAAIQGKGSTKQTQDTVVGFINSWKKNIGDDIYPAVRLWYPQEDEKLRQLTRIKETIVGKMIANVLLLPPKSAAFASLSNVKRGNFIQRASNASDEDGLAIRAKRAIDERVPLRDYSNLTIGDVLVRLGEFVEGTKESQMEIMRYFINTMNSDEFYWLIKIMQCNLNIRCSEKTFLRAFHPNAEQVYMVNKSLKTVCLQLWSKDFSVSEKNKSVKPLSFFCPMLAKYIKGMSVNFDSCVDLMSSRINEGAIRQPNDDGFYIEEKIDGERVQIHWVRQRNITKFFSRRSLDHTDSYQSVFSGFEGNKGTKTMSDFLGEDVENIILDGEVIAWDPKTNDFCGQSKVRELTNHVKPGQYKHMVFVFDIVYLNDEDLTNEPLSKRKSLLKSVFDPNKANERSGRLDMLPFAHGHTASDIAEKFKKIITEMSEGLVVKNPSSEYILNSRTDDWIKVKPEYIDGYGGETLDLVVVGAYRGSGKFQGNFGSYLVALRDESRHGRFVALSRIGSGICMAMHRYIDEKISHTRFSSPNPPEWLDLGTMIDTKPDAYIPYDKAMVFEIKYSEILSPETLVKSRKNFVSGYGVGYWLKFPRYVKLREDKNFETTTCIGEFLEIYAGRARHLPSNDVNVKRKNETKMSSLAKRVREDQQRKQKEATDNTRLKSRILAGSAFYLCGDIEQPAYYTENELSQIIRENGGTLRETYDADTYLIADRMLPKAAALVGSGHVIMHPCWLFDSISAGHLLTPEPVHYFNGRVEDSIGLVDKFGFSLHRKQSIAEIKRLVETMSFTDMKFSDADMNNAIAVWKLSEGKDLRSLLFVGFGFYIDGYTIPPDKAKLLSSLIHYAGGNVVEDLLLATNIICDAKDTSDLLSYNFQYGSKPIVSSEWVESCWFEKKIQKSQFKTEINL